MPRREILVTDDAVDDTRRVKLSREETAEMEVMIESDPDKATALARNFLSGVIRPDSITPTMTGGNFTDSVRGEASLKAPTIIFLTARIDLESVDGITNLLGSPCVVNSDPVDDGVASIGHSLGAL